MKRFVALLCLTSVFITTAGAQRTRPSTVAANTPASRTKCSGAWTGTITYTRIQNQSDNKTVPRVSGRGKDTRDWQFNYNYSAQVAVIEDPSRPRTEHRPSDDQPQHDIGRKGRGRRRKFLRPR